MFHFNGIKSNWLRGLRGRPRKTFARRSHELIQVAGKPGAIKKKTTIDAVVHDVPVGFFSLEEDYEAKIEELNDVLLTSDPKVLIFDDEPSYFWYAEIEGELDFIRNGNLYEGVIRFLCTDPHKYKGEKTFPFSNDAVSVNNNGPAKTPPIIDIEVENASTYIMVSDGAEKFNMIGDQIDIESTTAPFNPYTKVFDRLGNNLTGWTSGDTADGGVVQGSFLTDGQAFRANSYGASNSAWRGPALIQSLPQLLNDWRIDAFVTVKQEAINQFGRAEIYLLNAAGERIGKLAMKNVGEQNNSNVGEINIRKGMNSEFIIRTAGIRPRLWNDFYGVLRLEKKGNLFKAYIARIDNGVYNTVWEAEFTDDAGLFTDPLAAVQIHLGQYGTRNFITDMAIHRDVVYQVNSPTDNAIPIIVQPGDRVTFDHVKKVVLVNGQPRPDLKAFAGRWFQLDKGLNQLAIMPENIGPATISFRERSL